MELFLLYSRLRNVDYHRTLKEDPRVGALFLKTVLYICIFLSILLWNYKYSDRRSSSSGDFAGPFVSLLSAGLGSS